MSYARSSHVVAVPYTLQNPPAAASPWCALLTAPSREAGLKLARMYVRTGEHAIWHAQFSSRPERLDPELGDRCDRWYVPRDHRSQKETAYRHVEINSDRAEYFPLYADARKYAGTVTTNRTHVVLYTRDLPDAELPEETEDATVDVGERAYRFISVGALGRMSFSNSARLPQFVNDDGVRKHWVGIGWVPEGPATGKPDEAIVCHSGYEVTACVAERRLPLRLRPARAKGTT